VDPPGSGGAVGLAPWNAQIDRRSSEGQMPDDVEWRSLMTDAFDRFLQTALVPEQRASDRRFVAQVQARILLDESLNAHRREVVRQLVIQVVALSAVAAGLLWLGQAPAVAHLVAESPWLALSSLLSMFAFIVMLFTTGRSSGSKPTLVHLLIE
jgi:hypothetical protein